MPKEGQPDPPADFDPYEYFGVDCISSSNHPTSNESTSSHSSSSCFSETAFQENQRYDRWQQWAKNNQRMRDGRCLVNLDKCDDQKDDLMADHMDDCVALFMQFRVETRSRGIFRTEGRRGLLDPN